MIRLAWHMSSSRPLLDGLHLDTLALLQEHVQFHFDVLMKGPIVHITLKE